MLQRRTVQYLAAPGGIPKVLGIAVAVGTVVSVPFVHPSVRQAASGLGAALMLWWLGFKVREKG